MGTAFHGGVAASLALDWTLSSRGRNKSTTMVLPIVSQNEHDMSFGSHLFISAMQ